MKHLAVQLDSQHLKDQNIAQAGLNGKPGLKGSLVQNGIHGSIDGEIPEMLLRLSADPSSHNYLAGLPTQLARDIADQIKRSYQFSVGILLWSEKDRPEDCCREGMKICHGAASFPLDRLKRCISEHRDILCRGPSAETSFSLLDRFISADHDYLQEFRRGGNATFGKLDETQKEVVSVRLQRVVMAARDFVLNDVAML